MSVRKLQTSDSARWAGLIAPIILIVGFTFFYMATRVVPVTPEFGENQMSLTGPRGAPSPVVIEYQAILSATEVSDLDVGVNISGLCTGKSWFGIWRNDLYGEYTLCASPDNSAFIVLTTADGIVVFNYENENSTRHLYTAMLELLETKQQEGKGAWDAD